MGIERRRREMKFLIQSEAKAAGFLIKWGSALSPIADILRITILGN